MTRHHHLTFRPIEQWPEGWQDADRDKTRLPPPFSAPYSDTLNILDRELLPLGTTDVFAQVATNRIRQDGGIYHDAKITHPGVILTIDTRDHGTLVYATDRFNARWSGQVGWQMNLRAIALGLEALRKVTRYGIADQGQQYAGYKAIGAGIELHAAPPTPHAAARTLLTLSRTDPAVLEDLAFLQSIFDNPAVIADLYRVAAGYTHPDYGGDPELFRQATEARDILRAEWRRRNPDH